MGNKYRRGVILVIVGLFSLVLASCSVSASKPNSKPQNPKASKTIKRSRGGIDAKSLLKNANPVTKLVIGQTYVVLYPEYSDQAWDYIKIVDGQHYLFLEDLAHLDKKYYQQTTNNKIITMAEASYQQEGQDLKGITNQRQVILVFDPTTQVKAGAPGTYTSGVGEAYGVRSLVKRNGRYLMTNSLNAKSSRKIFVAKNQLPDSIDQYLAEYKLKLESSNSD